MKALHTLENLATMVKLMKFCYLILPIGLDDHERALLLATYVHSTFSTMEPTCVALERMGKD